MNPLSRTLTYAGAAGLSALLAFVAWSSTQPSSLDGFGEVGQAFFPDFDDATKATALSVADFDGESKEVQEFSVKQNDDGLWVIPSHHDYPAEAKDRLAKTATTLMGVKKTAAQSRSKDDWKLYGVVDPAADGAATDEERGTRLTLSDGSGNALVDLIIGKEVEGRDGNYYVREPEKNTTYIAELDVDLSAKFSDWIEPDLLKINSSDLVRIVLDNYSVDEQRGTVNKKEMLEFTKADLKTSGDWTLEGLDAETEELDKSPVSSIATNLDQLKIVGVRKKPEGLDDNLRVNPTIKRIMQQQLQAEMQAQGYFIGGDKDGNERLYANEGELVAGASNGVQYTLFFGEIARGTGKDIEVGLKQSDADKAKDDKKEGEDSEDKESNEDDADSEEEEDGPRRYLLLKAEFNEELLGPKPVAPEEPVKPEILKEETKPEEEKDTEKSGDGENPEAVEKEAAPTEGKPDQPAPAADKPKEAATEEEATTEPEADDSCGPQDEPTEEPAAEEPVADKPEAKPDVAADEKDETPAADDKPAQDKPADEKAEEKPKSDATSEEEKKDEPSAEPKEKDEKPADEPAAKDDAPSEGKSADETAKEETKPADPPKDPKQVAQEAYDAAMKKYEADKQKYESDLKAWEDKVKQGKEKAEELSRRFAGWYYVISSDSFEKFRITRMDVVSKKEAKEDEAEGDEAKDDK